MRPSGTRVSRNYFEYDLCPAFKKYFQFQNSLAQNGSNKACI